MTRSRAAVWLCAACACSMVGLGDRALRASAPSPPTVSVVRNSALYGPVWPVDLNGDGITDLVASDTTLKGNPESILAVLGNGDGTFGSPIKSSTTGEVLAVGDFNSDGKRDVVVRQIDSSGSGSGSASVLILPGNGDGTFAAPIVVGTFAAVTFARTADINGDRVMDLIVCDESTVYVYPGNGDFTFGTPASLATSYLLLGGGVADFNGDGKPDIAVASHDGGYAVRIYLNQGALNFTITDIPLDRRANDVIAADLNKDGHMDLVVATADSAADNPDAYVAGYAYVMLGRGDGTFAMPVQYQTAAGAWQVVVGDFTRDGMLDIATANRSAIYRDDCTVSLKTWDSVSILPGNGDGTFSAASSFSLGDQSKLFDDRFRDTVTSLNTSDVNGDGATDLIASWGAILKNNRLDPNWPPTVTASSTAPVAGDPTITLTAPASDSDQDMLTYSWIDSAGTTNIPPVPIACVQPSTGGVHTFTVTVNDQHGHTTSSSVTVDMGGSSGSGPITVTAPQAGETVPGGTPYTIRWTAASEVAADSVVVSYSFDNGSTWNDITECNGTIASAGQCTWNSPAPDTTQAFVKVCDANPADGCGSAGPFTIQGAPSNGLPFGWSQNDIGAVAAAGSGSFDSSTGEWTVTGDGADVWGTADAFHYVYRQTSQSFDMQARVDSVQNVSAWTKAGIMVRTSLDPGSPQASVFVTPGHGIVLQGRASQGATSISTSGPALTAPVWVRLAGYNGGIWAYYRKTITDPWTFIGRQVLSNYASSTPYVGFAVTSHSPGTLATATFSQLTFSTLPTWSGASIGVSGTNANASWDGTLFNIFTQSSDIWGTADAFMYVFTDVTGDTTITARVTRLDDTSAWAKAGVMFRESTAAGSTHVFLMVTPGKGVNLQYRATAGGISASAGSIAGVVPGWLRLQRAGNTFTGAWSTDGVTFRTVGSVTVSMLGEALVGMADTSHNTSTGGESRFDDVDVRQP